MHRLLALFACLAIMISLAGGSVAHAMEPIACIELGTEAGSGHSDGDGDQAADSDKNYPHHHGGCHGHHLAAQADETQAVATRVARSAEVPALLAVLAPVAIDPALRPPQA